MDPFLGEIRLFAGNYAPKDWALCDGALLAIQQSVALFNLLGTNYGGDGKTTFGLPDLRGRLAVGMGWGPGLSDYTQGNMAGQETVPLTMATIGAHSHAVNVVASNGDQTTPVGFLPSQFPGLHGKGTNAYAPSSSTRASHLIRLPEASPNG